MRIEHLDAGYGAVRVLEDVSVSVRPGETVALLGTNGNGKTTLMRSILGLIRPTRGVIAAEIDGETIDLIGRAPEEIVDLGIVLVPEGRRLFPRLTVEENLVLGASRPAARRDLAKNLAFCYEHFPKLRERRRQYVGSMSGGEQQMAALARAIMSAPRILLIDEPSVGLAPILVSYTIETIVGLKRELGLTVLMAEQNFRQAIRIADRGYVLVHGKIVFSGSRPRNSAITIWSEDFIWVFDPRQPLERATCRNPTPALRLRIPCGKWKRQVKRSGSLYN